MTTILPQARTSQDALDQLMGNSLSQNLPGAVQRGYQRQRGLNAIDQLQEQLKSANSDINQILPAIARAYTENPMLERSGIAEHALKQARAMGSQNVPLPGETQPSRNREQMEQVNQTQPLPQYMNRQGPQNEFFPSNVGPQGGPGHGRQTATTRQKEPLLTQKEKIAQAHQIANERTAAGIPTMAKEVMPEIENNEQSKKSYNAEVDKDLANVIKDQKTYGERAVDYLGNVYPKANDEVKAIFQKKGERAKEHGDSEADINRYLANEAKNFKNAIVNVEKDVSAPRLINSITRSANGSYKDFEQSAADVRRHLQPLLDLGLYDTSRNLLQDKGYGPEEREITINPLSEKAKAIVNQIPKRATVKKKPQFGRLGGYELQKNKLNTNDIKSGLIQMKKTDPNFSPLLARKAYEDKGYNWREFKDAWNELLNEGFELEDDQENMAGYLNTPPLNFLDKILHGLNIIGR